MSITLEGYNEAVVITMLFFRGEGIEEELFLSRRIILQLTQ